MNHNLALAISGLLLSTVGFDSVPADPPEAATPVIVQAVDAPEVAAVSTK